MEWDIAGSDITRDRLVYLYQMALDGDLDIKFEREEEKNVIIRCDVDNANRRCGAKLEQYVPSEAAFDVLDMVTNGSCTCLDKSDNGGNPEVNDIAGVSLLHVAAAQGHANLVRQLLDLGCDVNASTLYLERTALHMALSSNKQPALQLVEMLVEAGIDVTKADSSFQTALHMAVTNNFPNIIPLLAAAGCPVDYANSLYYTALQRAVSYGYTACVKELVSAGASVNITGPTGWTPLLSAVRNNQIDLIKILVKGNCDVNVKCSTGTALHYAAYRANAESTKILLEAGANPNVLSGDGHTPLTVAAYNNSSSVAELLLAHNSDVNLPSVDGYMPLHFAAWEGHTKFVKMLLEAGAMYDLQTADRNTPLALACHGDQLNVMKCLLPLGCNVNNTDKDDDSPIHYVTYNGSFLGLNILLEYGANPDAENNVRATPLWNAVHMRHAMTVAELIKCNVRLSVPSKGIDQHSQADHVVLIYSVPRTPLFVAFDRGLINVAKRLIYSGIDMSQEQWFWRREFPTALERQLELQKRLLSFVYTPLPLKLICRGNIRRCLGLQLSEALQHIEIPTTLKDFLLLKYRY